MNNKPKGTTFPKQQLEIAQAPEERPYGTGGKTLVSLNAKNLSLPEGDPLRDKYLKYVTFNPELKEHIKGLDVGARFLADIEERDRPESEYGPDRSIVQIYQDGKPVSQGKKGGGGYGKSPETVRLEHELHLELEGVKRRSIEGQTAVAQVGLVLTSPNPIPGEDLRIDEEDWTRILGKYWQAIEKGLDNYLAPQTGKKTAAPAPKADQKPQVRNPEAEKPAAVSKDTPPAEDPIKHVGDLLTRAAKLDPPVTRSDFLEIMAVNDPKEITDLEGAWTKALILRASRRLKSSEGKGDDKNPAAESSAEHAKLFE